MHRLKTNPEKGLVQDEVARSKISKIFPRQSLKVKLSATCSRRGRVHMGEVEKS